jgi:hypothetical protein
MITLACFDDYENPNKKFKAEDIIETFLFPKTQNLILFKWVLVNSLMVSFMRTKEIYHPNLWVQLS